MSSDAPDIIGTQDLALEANVSRQLIGRWAKEGLEEAAKIGRGQWHRERALSWISDRREDSPRLDGSGPSTKELLAARIELYRQQSRGADIRNRAAEGELVLYTEATAAVSEVFAEAIAAGDAWARDPKRPAAAPLRDAGISDVHIIARNQECWHELRRVLADAVRRVENRLAVGSDVGPTRIRVPRSVG